MTARRSPPPRRTGANKEIPERQKEKKEGSTGETGNEIERGRKIARERVGKRLCGCYPVQHQRSSGRRDSRGPAVVLPAFRFPTPSLRPRNERSYEAPLPPKHFPHFSGSIRHSVGSHRLALYPQFVSDRASVRFVFRLTFTARSFLPRRCHERVLPFDFVHGAGL